MIRSAIAMASAMADSRAGHPSSPAYVPRGSRTEQKVLIIDGGKLGRIWSTTFGTYYGTTFVDAVVCTHPDIDHACSLKVVLEELDFGFLLMHQPWHHASEILDLFKNPCPTTFLRASDELRGPMHLLDGHK